MTDNGNKVRDIDNYFKCIHHSREIVKGKLEIILLEKNNSNIWIIKRDIIDGIGSVLKFITGNLDDYDSKKYDKMLKEMKDDQINIKNQSESQCKISSLIIIEYNKMFSIVEEKFLEKVGFVNNRKNDFVELKRFINILSQLNIFHYMLLWYRELTNICKLGVLHPSVISIREL